MLKKMDVTMSTFKVTLLKALVTTNTSPSPKKQWLGPAGSFLIFDQSGVRGGAIAVPNLRDRRSVGKKVQNSQHFLSKIVELALKTSTFRPFFAVNSLYRVVSDKTQLLCLTSQPTPLYSSFRN